MTNASTPTPTETPARTRGWSWLGQVLQVLLGVTTAVALLALTTHLAQRSLAVELRADPFGVPLDRIEAADARVERVDTFALVAIVVTGIVFAAWTFVGYRRLDPVRDEKRYANGWAIAGWVVPFANLFVPYRVVRDLWAAEVASGREREWTAHRDARRAFPLVSLWWGCWVLAMVLGPAIQRSEGQTIDDVVTVNTVAAARFGVLAAAGVLAIAVVHSVEKARRGSRTTDSHPGPGQAPGSTNQEQ